MLVVKRHLNQGLLQRLLEGLMTEEVFRHLPTGTRYQLMVND